MMNINIFSVVCVTALLAAFALPAIALEGKGEVRAEESPAGKYRITEPTYSLLATAAGTGDCQAADRLARHHVFFSLKTSEAIRWYRMAARCPDPRAKGELVGILMHFENEDSKVDRLLLEIEKIDPQAAQGDRAAVHSVRSSRQSDELPKK